MPMRYILYFFTLALVFTSGMVVGNFYVPDHSRSLAAAISIPDAQADQAILSLITAEKTQSNLDTLNQALESCPLVVSEEKEQRLHEVALFLAVQDFQVKKAVYEAEIAKNITGNPPTAQLDQAAQEYTLAKARVEELVQLYFPPEVPEETEALPAQTAASSTTLSTATVAAQ